MFEISERDLFWLAGYLEGEGCFSVRRLPPGRRVHPSSKKTYVVKREQFCFSIIVATTDYDIAEKVARIMRCNVKSEIRDKRGNRKPLWCVCLGRRQEVSDLLKLLLPLMGERRSAKIREMIRQEAKYPAYDRVKAAAWMRAHRPRPTGHKTQPRIRGRWASRTDDPNQPKLIM